MKRHDDSILRYGKRRSMIVIAIFGALLCVAPTSARAQFFGAPSQNSRQYATQQPQGRAATNAGQSQALAQQAAMQRQAQQRQAQANQARQAEQRKPLFSGLFGLGSNQPQRAPSQSQPNAAQQRQYAQQRQQPEPPRDRRGLIPQSSNDFHHSSQHIPVGAPQTAPPSAAMDPEMLARPSSDPRDAREALAKLPRDVMPQATYDKLMSIASNATVYRRLPMGGCRCNPELFDYFLSYPNAVVELWKHMGYNEIDMKAMGNDRYILSENNGSRGDLQVIYQDSETTIVYATGNYRAPAMIRAVEGEAFFILQTRYTEDAALTPIVICRLDGFIKIKNPGVDFLARAFNSTVGKIADANFEQTLAFIDSVSQTAEQNPIEFQSIAANLRGLSPEARSVLSTKAYEMGRQAAARQRGQIVNYRLLAKRNAPNPGYARILSRGDANYGEYLANTAPKNLETGPNALPSSLSSTATSGAPGFASSRSLTSSGNDFALSNDDFESSIEWEDDGSMMTGEEFLSTQSGSSLARVGAKPISKPNAINALEANERVSANATAPLGTLSTESFTIGDDETFEYEDEELVIEGADSTTATSVARPNPMASSLRPTPFPPTLHAPNRSANTAQPLNDEQIESEHVADITIGEDGALELDFVEDEGANSVESGDVGTNDALAEAQPLVLEPASKPEPAQAPQLAPYAESLHTPEINKEDEVEIPDTANAPTEEEPKRPVDSWTRATLPRNFQPGQILERKPLQNAAKKVEKAAKRTERNVKKFENKVKEALDDEDRPRFITRRYEPLKFRALDPNGKSTQNAPKQEEPVTNYKWLPTQQSEVVAKTAAIDESNAHRTATFKKPEVK